MGKPSAKASASGGKEAPCAAIELRAGPLEMVFEPGEAFLRYVRLGSQEVLRGIYAAVRDRNWGTVKPQVRNLAITQGNDSFDVSFDVECKEGDIDFLWKGRLTGTPDGSVVYEFDGLARLNFLRNRIGFCVLHPIEPCAGKPCTVRKADGTVLQSCFPRWISPHQPFQEMRGISHPVLPGIEAAVTFDGDLFEMEDQRNWTDASYKTYCTPLEMPFPVEVAKGARIHQSVTLRLNITGGVAPAAGPTTPPRRPAPVTLTVDLAALRPLPKIGLAVASHGRPLGDRQIERLRALELDHLRVDLPLGQAGWRQRLEQAAMQAQRLGVSLQAAITLADDAEAELTALTAECKKLRPPVADWLVFHAREKTAGRRWIGLATEILRMGGCPGRIVSGTNAYFAELNRNRPPVEVCEAICYSVNPQVHAFDNASLTETLPAQGYTVESARQFAAGRPILVTPVTLRPRFNPNATGPEEPTPPGQLPSQVDPRQPTLFAAAWTLGSVRYLAAAGADSVTYYETTGWRGVMELEEGCLLSDRFPSIPGGVFPLYHVLADVGGFAGSSAAAVQSSDPLKVEGLALADGKRCRLLVGNFTAARQNVVIRMPGVSNVHVATMAPSNVELAMSKPEEFRRGKGEPMDAADGRLKLDLPPEGILRLDGVVKK